MPDTDAPPHDPLCPITQQCEDGISPKGRQMFQEQMLARGTGTALHSHGFLAGGEICKLRYGLLSESSRRLYFWRPPRTRSRRTPFGEEREKVSELFNITRGISADFGISAMAKSSGLRADGFC